MLTLTFDTNCIIALARDEQPHASCLRDLVELHSANKVTIRITAMSASEKQQPDKSYLKEFSDFQKRLKSLGLGNIEPLKPMCYFDVSFWDWCVYGGGELSDLDKRIHNVLFPGEPVALPDVLKQVADAQDTTRLEETWRNHKCDVLAMWCHIYYSGDVFVTTDGNFTKVTKQERLKTLGAGEIHSPRDALSLVHQTLSVDHGTG